MTPREEGTYSLFQGVDYFSLSVNDPAQGAATLDALFPAVRGAQ